MKKRIIRFIIMNALLFGSIYSQTAYADTVHNNNNESEEEPQSNSSNVSEGLNASKGSNINSNQDNSTYTVTDNDDKNKSTQTSNPEASSTNTYTDTKISGVVTIKNVMANLYDVEGNLITDRVLPPASAWKTDRKHISSNGIVYYRVSTKEYVRENDVNFSIPSTPKPDSPNGNQNTGIEKGSGKAIVCIIKDYGTNLYNGYGSQAVWTNKRLRSGTAWVVINQAYYNGHNWYEVGNNQWITDQDVVITGSQNYEKSVHLNNVPLISQRPELPNGCEITAVTMMLQYAGAKVDKMNLAKEMPRSSNPNYGYIGNPWDNTGITIFPPALMGVVKKYTPTHTAKNLTGLGFDAIKYQLSLGHAVVTWNTMHGFPYHALTITGYDHSNIYYNDCWTNTRSSWNINSFISNWNTQSQRALSY